ncbi:CAP domain-containing protein [candidate division WS5 bacterium]|uniref:CAP domain-containing protein n=1 Tax=candidate division WS5 bacterium TaxID=2093353 RepID=A0A419DA89_9BACT|nr:MAG: CAP domain-containing protein [candidate division WS5 bacterium]
MAKKKSKKFNLRDFLHKVFIPSHKNSHRPYALRHLMLSIYSVALIISHLSFGAVQYTPVTANPDELAKDVLAGINTERRETGRQALVENNLLKDAAQNKLKDMFRKNYWDHSSPTGVKAWGFINETGYSYTSAGENLARGFISADSMVEAWMDSETHKKNILDENFTETGIAVGNGVIGNKETTVAVQLFGAPSAAFTQSSAIVAGEKSVSPNFSLSRPLTGSNTPYFVVYMLIFSLILFDGIMLRINKNHKDRKHLFAFRTSLGLSTVFLLVLCISLTQTW